jgi:methylated-DNA-[protein]-cysteine S-methyltransferase
MTTLPIDDAAIEAALGDLTLTAPRGIAPDVLVEVGLADRYATAESPIGQLYVAWNGRGVSTVGLARDDAAFEAEHRERTGRSAFRAAALPPALGARIARRIAGDRRASVRVDLRGRSDFERDVLLKAAQIPHGEVRPYGWIAAEIGRPKAVRAVGTALGHNPVPLIVPCHRVVRTDGSIGHYSLGGPEIKRAILAAEGLDPDAFERRARAGEHYTGSRTTHIVCNPTCRHARRVMDKHRVWFRSLDAAADAGYRPCKVCRPASGAGAVAIPA